MKEFEKWLKENGYGSLKDNHDNSCDNSFIMGIEAGWQAALEEAIKHSDPSLVYLDSAIATWIRKELG